MKKIFAILFLGLSFGVIAQNDTLVKKPANGTKFTGRPIQKEERVAVRSETLTIFGDYKITGYLVVASKSPSKQELDKLVGTSVKIQETSVTGTEIDPLTYEIYQVELQKRDDYLFRVFGKEGAGTDPVLPESFYVHKTSNAAIYGIAVTGNGTLVIPYKGVLLFLGK